MLRRWPGVLHLLRDSLRPVRHPALQTKVQAGLRPGDAALLHSAEEEGLRGELRKSFLFFYIFTHFSYFSNM